MNKNIFNYFNVFEKDKTHRIKQKIFIANNLIKKHKTPFLIIQEKEILNSITLFKKYLPEIDIHYAIKANADTYILELLNNLNISFDVASSGEIKLLSKLKINGDRMILANPVKNFESLKTAIQKRIKAYTFDNIYEIEKISSYLKKRKTKFIPASILRIKTYSENVQTNLSEKFGADIEEAYPLLKYCKEHSLNPVGIAFHVGTQSFDIKNYEKGIISSLEVINKCKKDLGLDLKVLDIGGGFPIDSIYGSGTTYLEEFFIEFSKIYKKYNLSKFTILAEPGRIISGPSGTLVTTVIGKSKREGKMWLFLDDGVYGSYSGIMYDHALFNYIPLNPRYHTQDYKNKLIPYVIAGPTCDSVDIMQREVYLPEDIKIGDNILSSDIGAYSIMSATKFNGFRLAKVLYLNKDDELENIHMGIDFDINEISPEQEVQ